MKWYVNPLRITFDDQAAVISKLKLKISNLKKNGLPRETHNVISESDVRIFAILVCARLKPETKWRLHEFPVPELMQVNTYQI